MRRKKWIRRFFWSFLILFLLINFMAFMHAYKMTHFSNGNIERTSSRISFLEKMKVIFTGVNNPRPVNRSKPLRTFETHFIQSNQLLESWFIKADNPIGTMILFHGYAGDKSGMLDKAEEFFKIGYNTMLVDFMGSGGSAGSTTTIGFKEAEEVKDVYQYVLDLGLENISLFGTSMGAVAIMKAIKDFRIQPSSIIIECPFGTMYKTVKARFKMNGLPSFPLAGLLVFWGGVQNNFWAFSHNPEGYAKYITCPTLLMYGETDDRVSREEINMIYNHLKGRKRLRTYSLSGHENYLLKNRSQWVADVNEFLSLNE